MTDDEEYIQIGEGFDDRRRNVSNEPHRYDELPEEVKGSVTCHRHR